MKMKQYLLDTCACIAIIRRNKRVMLKTFSVGHMNCFVSEMTIAELYYGASKSGLEKHFHDVDEIRDCFQIVLVFDSLRTFGETKANLERQGNRLDDMDLLIGSTALHNGMTLVTHNTRHLSRIVGLELEDWE